MNRCVREHFGYVDCSVDVAEVLDRHWSAAKILVVASAL